MSKQKINDTRLLWLIDKEKKNQSEAAKVLGVSRQAVNQRLQRLRGRTTRVIVAKKIEQIVDRKINVIDQLNQINQDANEILDLLMRLIWGDDESLQILEGKLKTTKIRIGNKILDIQTIKSKHPIELALKVMAEIRGELKLQIDIFRELYSVKAVEEFQNVVIETITEASPDVRNKIIRKLYEKQPLRNDVKFN